MSGEPRSAAPRALRIAAAIPAYQAAATVGDVARRTLEQLQDVLVVDDGSTDDTSRAARDAGAEVVRVERNCGKGNALHVAFDLWFARGFDAVITLDADGQHIPEEIPTLLQAAERADLVVGGREALFAGMSRLRRNSNRISSRLISIVAGQRLADVQSGFRLYRRQLIASTGFPEPRFEAESAVIVRAARRGHRIVTVPVRLAQADGRTTSHYRPVADSVRIGVAVLRARWESLTWIREPSS